MLRTVSPRWTAQTAAATRTERAGSFRGEEIFDVGDLDNAEAKSVRVTAAREGADPIGFGARVRLDTPNEVRYFQHGGILHRVLRDLRAAS